MITVQEVKDFLNITDTTNDEFISGCISKAVGEINVLTNRNLDYRENTEYYAGSGKEKLYLNDFPSESVSSIKAYNKNGDYTFATIFEGSDTVENSTQLISGTGLLILKKGYTFTENFIIEIIYTAGYKENGTVNQQTPYDLQGVLVKLAAKQYLESFKGNRLFLKKGENIGGAASSGNIYKELDLSPIITKYRRFNI